MGLIIADTGPVNYLLLTGYIDILPGMFEKVILPAAVRDELFDADSPELVRTWIATPPHWLEVGPRATANTERARGAGERAAITLALDLNADLLLMDDRQGVKAARRKGIEVTGTLGVLSRAGQRGLVNLAEAFDRLKRTSFRYPQELMDLYLDQRFGEP